MTKKDTDKSALGEPQVTIPSNVPSAKPSSFRQGRLVSGAGAEAEKGSSSPQGNAIGPGIRQKSAVITPNTEPPTLSATRSFSIKVISAVLLSAAIIGAGIVYVRSNRSKNVALFEEHWYSNDSSKMQRVAERAYESPRSSAAEIIVNEALRGEKHPPVRDHLLRTAFRREWERDLSDRDREVIFRVALLGVAPSPSGSIVIDATLHAGTLFSLLADLPENAFATEFSNIPLAKLFELPGIFGESFKALEPVGAKSLDDPAVRALAALVSGTISADALRRFFASQAVEPDQVEAVVIAKFRVLLQWTSRFEMLAPLLVEHAEMQSAVLSERLRWFEEEHRDYWIALPLLTKLTLVSGSLPGEAFSFEQTCDLLRFPSASVRKEAGQRLAPVFHRSMAAPLTFLAGSNHQLTRSQVVLLLSALRLEGDAAMPFISGWFVTEPHPASVVEFLAQTVLSPGLEIFNLEAGRYLRRKSWGASRSQLQKLILHPEPIVRALAYSKLDPQSPEDLALLRKALAIETDPKLRENLRNRMQPG